jgi:hypothetical protein
MAERVSRVIPRYLCLLVPAFLLCGCGSRQAYPTYMHPELLYLKDRPYAKLHIEVDSVEGAEVPQGWLDELAAFFAEHCDKPGGITMARDEPIPLAEVKDLTVTEAALLYTDGPPTTDDTPPAYVHVFCYDLDDGLSAMVRNPHVLPFYPTTIFFNVDYAHYLPGYVRGEMLQHEAGHVLGLSENRSHADGTHCRNRGCLMRRSEEVESEIIRWVSSGVGAKFRHGLCDDCRRDLESLRADETAERLSFAGPFLIRRENEYSVASLPFCDLIGSFPAEEFDWQKTLEFVKRRMTKSISVRREPPAPSAGDGKRATARASGVRAPKKGRGYSVFCMLPSHGAEPSLPTRERQLALLAEVSEDPCPMTRGLARYALKKTEGSPPAAAQAPAASETQ